MMMACKDDDGDDDSDADHDDGGDDGNNDDFQIHCDLRV